jgi:hypothetical protein
MNLLDENFPESQRPLLPSKRIPLRQIGKEIGRKGMKDEEIIRLPHQLDRPTFFTLDADFYDRQLCHQGYSGVHLDVKKAMAAKQLLRVLRHPQLKSKAMRMGRVIRAFPTGLSFWCVGEEKESHLTWSDR